MWEQYRRVLFVVVCLEEGLKLEKYGSCFQIRGLLIIFYSIKYLNLKVFQIYVVLFNLIIYCVNKKPLEYFFSWENDRFVPQLSCNSHLSHQIKEIPRCYLSNIINLTQSLKYMTKKKKTLNLLLFLCQLCF